MRSACCDRPTCGDAVALELLAGLRIVDVDAVGAEIAAARRRGRDRQQARSALRGPRPLVITEVEPAVLHNRPADRRAELVALGLGNEAAGERIGLELRERVARLQRVVLEELEGAAAQRVGTRPRLHRDDAGDGQAELRVVVLRGDLRLADRLQRRVDDDDAEDRIAVVGAIELVVRAAEVLAVDHRLGRALRVLAGGVLPLQLLRAGREQQELGEVAIEHRQVGELP